MKKILCALLLMLISVSSYSQRLSHTRLFYKSDNTYHIASRIHNTTNKTIVGIVVHVTYDGYTWTGYTAEPIIYTYNFEMRVFPGYYMDFKFQPDQLQYKPTRLKLYRVIFSDGSYKNF